MSILSKYYKVIIGAIIGAIGGYAYYYFVGCNSGSCPITSNPFVSTTYGLVMGVVAFFPFGKKEKEE